MAGFVELAKRIAVADIDNFIDAAPVENAEFGHRRAEIEIGGGFGALDGAKAADRGGAIENI